MNESGCEKAEPRSEWIPVTVIVVGVGGVGGVDRYYTVGTGTGVDRSREMVEVERWPLKQEVLSGSEY